MLLKAIDRETNKSKYNLKIQAIDSGLEQRLSSTIQIELNCIDWNDNAPFFEEPYLRLRLNETENNSNEILQIRALDSDFGLNSKIRYFIENPKEIWNKFELNPFNGTLKLTPEADLDAEERNKYLIKIRAYDSGEFIQLKSEILEIFVEIDDVNDNIPIIRNSNQLDIFISNSFKIGI